MAVSTKSNHENYLFIDAGAGIPAEMLVAVGLDPRLGRGQHELKTFTCNHCATQLIVNPWRTRERAWCKSCDHYVCDRCKEAQVAAGGACRPFRALADEVAEAFDKGKDLSTVDVPLILLP